MSSLKEHVGITTALVILFVVQIVSYVVPYWYVAPQNFANGGIFQDCMKTTCESLIGSIRGVFRSLYFYNLGIFGGLGSTLGLAAVVLTLLACRSQKPRSMFRIVHGLSFLAGTCSLLNVIWHGIATAALTEPGESYLGFAFYLSIVSGVGFILLATLICIRTRKKPSEESLLQQSSRRQNEVAVISDFTSQLRQT